VQDFVGGSLSRRGVASNYSTEKDWATIGPRKAGAKRDTPEVIALIRLCVRKGEVQSVLRALADQEGPLRGTFKGASSVYGDYDILLQLGADTFDEVAVAAYGPLQEIAGIESTDTAFTDARRYED
jgi:hypothetical protein